MIRLTLFLFLIPSLLLADLSSKQKTAIVALSDSQGNPVGTAFFISPTKLAAAGHSVEDGGLFYFTVPGTSTYITAKPIMVDNSQSDTAVLKVIGEYKSPTYLKKTNRLNIGDPVAIYGYPSNGLTVTVGEVIGFDQPKPSVALKQKAGLAVVLSLIELRTKWLEY